MATPAYLLQSVRTAFAQAWRQLHSMSGPDMGIMNAAFSQQSTSKEEDYGWLGAMPAVTEHLKEATLDQVENYDITIRNRDWIAGVPFRKSNYKDDKTGSAPAIGTMLAQRLFQKPGVLIEDLLIAGDSNTAYDGVAFFANASGVRDNDNLIDGTGTTLAQVMADIESAEKQMTGFVDDKGEYLNITPNIIVCGQAIYHKVLRAVGSPADPTASGGINTFNPFYGKYQVVKSPRVGADDANDFYVLAANGILAPFIAQTREQPTVEIEDRPTVPTYGIVATSRGNVGYGLPQLALKVVNS